MINNKKAKTLTVCVVMAAIMIAAVGAWVVETDKFSINIGNTTSAAVKAAYFDMEAAAPPADTAAETKLGIPGENDKDINGAPRLNITLKPEGNRAFVYCIELTGDTVSNGDIGLYGQKGAGAPELLGVMQMRSTADGKAIGSKFYGVWAPEDVLTDGVFTVSIPMDIHYHGKGVIDSGHMKGGANTYDGNKTQGYQFILKDVSIKVTYCQATAQAVKDVFGDEAELTVNPTKPLTYTLNKN